MTVYARNQRSYFLLGMLTFKDFENFKSIIQKKTGYIQIECVYDSPIGAFNIDSSEWKLINKECVVIYRYIGK